MVRLNMEDASPDVRGCEAGVREDHQTKTLVHSAWTRMDRFAAAGLDDGHKVAMALKDSHKTDAK